MPQKIKNFTRTNSYAIFETLSKRKMYVFKNIL